MSDIFKKIRSIEAEDDAIIEALGLPARDSNEGGDELSDLKTKPLNLSVPDDEGILDLTDLTLETPETKAIVDNGAANAIDSPEAPSVRSRLGLMPLASLTNTEKAAKPILKRAEISPVKTPPLPKAEASPKPLPGFMESRQEMADPNVLSKPPIVRAKNFNNASEPHNDSTSSKGRSITIMGSLAALVWLICAGLLLADIISPADGIASMSALQRLGFALMALLPLFLIGLTTYAFRHLSKFTAASDKLKRTAEALMTPDDTVITRSTIMAKTIQAQVDEVNLKVSSALTRMELLDDMVKSQGSSLAKSTLAVDNTTSDIEHRISSQRDGLESIAGLFEDRMATLSSMMENHSTQLASSGHMAEQRVQEARLSVEGAAEKIASASETVRENAVAAAQTLTGSQIEIAKLGADVQEQSTRLDAVYRQHLTDLKVMLTDLRTQQDELGATMEERLSKMRDMSMSAKVGAQSLTEASIKGRETVEALNEAASLTDTAVRARFSEMEDMVKYSTARAESISETATRQVQNSLSSTRKEIARIEADMMDLMDKLSAADVAKTMQASSSVPSLRGQSTIDNNIPPEEVKRNELLSMEHRNIMREATDNDVDYDSSTDSGLFHPRQGFEDSIPPHPNLDHDLEILTPTDQDLPAPLRRPYSDEEKKERSKWSLKGIFGGADAILPSAPSTSARDVSDSYIIERLTTLGLTPAAIVDDGCIIEASNLRKVKGHAAMSEAVVKRLSEPVRHLFKAAETDAGLKSELRAFTAQFEARLAPNEGDREAIRTRLESDGGRAYLLCDAALNA